MTEVHVRVVLVRAELPAEHRPDHRSHRAAAPSPLGTYPTAPPGYRPTNVGGGQQGGRGQQAGHGQQGPPGRQGSGQQYPPQ